MVEKIYSKNPDIVFRKIADEFILVPVRHKVADLNCIYVLNEVGALIWEFIDGKRALDEILDSIIEAYDVERETAKNDLLSFINQLLKTESIEAAHA
ncbi:MAG: PqqD family protein [Deltaproteobacteria bacterium]|nr:PqqD family protein [Deltaproteobacteria bacterium]